MAVDVTPDFGASVLTRLGREPIINACGIYPDLGGSRLSPSDAAASEAIPRKTKRGSVRSPVTRSRPSRQLRR